MTGSKSEVYTYVLVSYQKETFHLNLFIMNSKTQQAIIQDG